MPPASGPATTTAAPPLGSRHWLLFADWCTATDHQPLPATADTVLAFLADIPAGPATTLRRIRAVDAAHRAAGWPPPSAAPALDQLLRPERPPRFDPAAVTRALEATPVAGWPAGLVGRRNAAILALVCAGGLTRRTIHTLHLAAGPDRWRVEPAVPPLPATPRPETCPACAVTRWLRAAHLTATDGWRAVRNQLTDLADTPDTDPGHDCTRPLPTTPGRSSVGEASVPLFTPIDRHGVPQPWPLSTRSITAITAARLTAPSHHGIVDDTWDRPDPTRTASLAWGEEDRARGVAARTAASERYAQIEHDLDEADAYAEAILARLDAALNGDEPV